MTLLRRCGALAGLAVGACVSPKVPPPDPDAVDRARRDERLKVMQQYWDEQTSAPPEEAVSGEEAALLDYPAGDYGGIRFGPRRAPDPSLAEPRR